MQVFAMWQLSLILLLAGLVWFWLNSMRVHESALAAARQACERNGLQFLDSAAVCIAIRPSRNEDGRLTLRRTYRFEFSDDRFTRREGTVVMLGDQAEALTLDPFLMH